MPEMIGTATVVSSKRPAPGAAPPEPGRWVVTVPGWLPTPLNRLLKAHWGTAHRLKEADYQHVAAAMFAAGVPEATRQRRVSLRLIVGGRSKERDADSGWKVILDALVACRRLVDDSRRWCVLGPSECGRGTGNATVLTLEDV